MQRIYSNPDPGIVQLVKNELDNLGIDSMIRGEHAAAVIGGGSGFDAWVELWLLDLTRLDEASAVVERIISDPDDAVEVESWECPSCGETVDGEFAACWNCGSARPES